MSHENDRGLGLGRYISRATRERCREMVRLQMTHGSLIGKAVYYSRHPADIFRTDPLQLY